MGANPGRVVFLSERAVREAWDIAWLVEGERARERLRLKRRRRTPEALAGEFDPHAATELALLMERRIPGAEPKPGRRRRP